MEEDVRVGINQARQYVFASQVNIVASDLFVTESLPRFYDVAGLFVYCD